MTPPNRYIGGRRILKARQHKGRASCESTTVAQICSIGASKSPESVSVDPSLADERVQSVYLDQSRRILAQRSLLWFCRHLDGTFTEPPHIVRMARELERVESGEVKRLIIELPPRHAKSMTLVKASAWYLGRHPERNIITCSHSAELAERNSRLTRALVADDRFPFPVRLSKDTTAQNRWTVSPGGGGLMAVGVLGSITGHGGNLVILDDIEHDERSLGERRAAWEWYKTICAPRLEPGGAIVCVCTRWAEDDVAGRLLAGDDGQSWERLILPAIALEDDLLGREVGAALWPERFSLSELRERQVTMGSRSFSAQFQQNPLPLEGALVKAEWLQRYTQLPPFQRVVMGLDTAAKTGVANDFSALVVLGVTRAMYFVIDVVRRKVEFPDLLRMVSRTCEMHDPSAVYVESSSNGVALIQALKSGSRLPIVSVTAKGSKISRVEGICGLLEAGKVLLPENAPWLTDLEDELLHFPVGRHDDIVDALVLALYKAQQHNSISIFTVGINGVSPMKVIGG